MCFWLAGRLDELSEDIFNCRWEIKAQIESSIVGSFFDTQRNMKGVKGVGNLCLTPPTPTRGLQFVIMFGYLAVSGWRGCSWLLVRLSPFVVRLFGESDRKRATRQAPPTTVFAKD
jgi:hypothetical protein